MVDVTISLANADVAPMLAWLKEKRRELVPALTAPTPTSANGRATLIYTTLGRLMERLEGHTENLKQLEAEARERRGK